MNEALNLSGQTLICLRLFEPFVRAQTHQLSRRRLRIFLLLLGDVWIADTLTI